MTEAKYNPESCEKCRYFSALENACCYNGRTRCIKDEQFPSASQLTDGDRAVSLNAVMDILNKIQADIEDGEGYDYHKWKSIVDELPSVTPERPNGHWIIKHRNINKIEYHTGEDVLNDEIHTVKELIRYETDDPYCSECGKRADDIAQDFCGYCGVRIREESEIDG